MASFTLIFLHFFMVYQESHGTGILSLRFLNFSNPTHQLANRNCCGYPVRLRQPKCLNTCENSFEICVTGIKSNKSCGLGKEWLSFMRGDAFDFPVLQAENPLLFPFTTWKGGVLVNITVEHVKEPDRSMYLNPQIVAHYSYILTQPTHNIPINLRGKYAGLDIIINVYCDRNYLGPDCSEYCQERDDDQGHYQCDYCRGMKRCLTGWYDPSSNCTRKKKICFPRNDHQGHFLCDPVSGRKICLTGWEGEKCNRFEQELVISDSKPHRFTNRTAGINEVNSASSSTKGCPVFTFEQGITGWISTGEAFSNQPVFSVENEVVGHVGYYYVDSRKNRTSPCQNSSTLNQTLHTGTLTSPNFTIRGDKLRFKIGGSQNNTEIRVELVVNGAIEKVVYPTHKELQYQEWEGLRQYENQTATIVLVDNRTDGYLVFDDLRYQSSDSCINQREQQNGFLCSCPTNVGISHPCASGNSCNLARAQCRAHCHERDTNCSCQQCTCNKGYKFDPKHQLCVDIDECVENLHNCNTTSQYNCVNTEGSYKCVCKRTGINGDFLNKQTGTCHSCGKGYTSDGLTCSDINECKTNKGGCEHNCVNMDGSYICNCYEGYKRGSDPLKCVDIDECSLGRHSCSEKCENTPGSYKCVCKNGYKVSSDQVTCVDEDECKINNGGCGHTCQNTDGSYTCKCNPGFLLAYDSKTCIDKDECSLKTANCHQNCINTNGSYTCSCFPGYVLQADNNTCLDIDECRSGYKRSANNSCEDIDECEVNSNCSHGCVNYPGSFKCECPDGFAVGMDNSTCVDVDECANTKTLCDQRCTNNEGSYLCLCYDGFSLKDDGKSCQDIDECYQENHHCEQTCINTQGSYQCNCNIGYRLKKDGRSCKELHVNSIRATKEKIEKATMASQVVSLSESLADDLRYMNMSGEEFNETVLLLSTLQSKWQNETLKASTQQAKKGVHSLVDIGDSLLKNIKEDEWKNNTAIKSVVASIPIRVEKIIEMIFKSTQGILSIRYQTSNIAVRVKNVTKHNFQGMTFPSDTQAFTTHVFLPRSVVNDNQINNERVGITQVFYKSKSLSKAFQGEEMLNSQVLSVKVLNVDKNFQQNLKEPIKLVFRHLKNQKNATPLCSFLNEDAVEHGGRLWLQKGCTVSNSTENYTVCHCYHLTSYGLLMDVHNIYEDLQPMHKEILGYISLVGCCISIVFCLLSVLGFCLAKKPDKRKARQATYKLHINLVIAIAFSQVFFVAGMFLTEKEKISCRAVAVVTHYFLCASFCWMLVEGINVYNKIVKVFSTKNYHKYYYVLGWGFPLVLVTASAAGIYKEYGQDTAICFLPPKYIWLFAGPVVVIVLVNIFVLGSIVYALIRKTQFKVGKKDEGTSKVRRTLKICAVLLPLLGVSWLFGFMAADKNTIFFHYLFAIVNSLQGVFIFFAHCWINDKGFEEIIVPRYYLNRIDVRTALKERVPSLSNMTKYNIAEKMRGLVESSAADTTETTTTTVTGSVLFTKVHKDRTASCSSYISATNFSTLELHQPHPAVGPDKGNFIDFTDSKESQCL